MVRILSIPTRHPKTFILGGTLAFQIIGFTPGSALVIISSGQNDVTEPAVAVRLPNNMFGFSIH